MTNFINRLSLKVIYFLYILGKCFGIVTATYYPSENRIRKSKLQTKIFAGVRTAVTFLLVILTFAFSEYDSESINIPFLLQNAFTLATTSLLVVTQLRDANELISVINEFIVLKLELSTKKGVNQMFKKTFFVMLLVKVISNTYLCLSDIPLLFTTSDGIAWLLFCSAMFIWGGTLIFFNFAFIGLIMASAFQANMFDYLQNCWKIKEIDEYSKLSLRFYKVFNKFIGLTRIHFLMALIFYTLSIGTGLSITLSSADESTPFVIQAFGYITFCIIDVLLFNMAADLVERSSRKRDFAKVDLLTNDTRQVCVFIDENNNYEPFMISRWTFSTFK